MHLQVNKKNKIFFYFILFVLFTTINNHNFYELKNKIFKINSIEIYGLKDKDKIQVIEKFSYLLGKNLLFLDNNKISYEMEKLEYLENYKIIKKYPTSINIYADYTNIIAKTFIGGNMSYLASNGKFINNPSLSIPKFIPNIYGKFDPKDYFSFVEILKKNKFQPNEITEFFYFDSKRWDIKTREDIIIKFPSTDLDQYVNIAKLLIKNNNEKKIIDLRVSNQVIITNE
tara:strand:- start:335 stop:1021 length:687 start_codon:yes stop_codon:yes gene_type:complete